MFDTVENKKISEVGKNTVLKNTDGYFPKVSWCFIKDAPENYIFMPNTYQVKFINKGELLNEYLYNGELLEVIKCIQNDLLKYSWPDMYAAMMIEERLAFIHKKPIK